MNMKLLAEFYDSTWLLKKARGYFDPQKPSQIFSRISLLMLSCRLFYAFPSPQSLNIMA
jgi:hypothetical protein